MGRLKHYQHCEVIIAPEGNEPACTVGGCEDEMVHHELKNCNSRNELGKQNNGKRFLTDKEIKALVEQFVKDDDIIAQTYEEIAKRRNLESGEYVACEVGYPSQKEELLMPYIEDPTEPTKTVYPYVPVEVIEQVIEKHGGWFDVRIPFA